MASAAFYVDGAIPTGPILLTAGTTCALSLADTAGVTSVAYSFIGASESVAYPALTTTALGTVTFTVPAAPSHGYGLTLLAQCVVNGSSATADLCVGTIEQIATNETTERGAVGWMQQLNENARSAQVLLNGSPVTAIATEDIHATQISAGTGTILRPIPNVYGDRDVARRLVDSLTPAKKVTVIHWGDSRNSDQSAEQMLMTYGVGVPWSGAFVAVNMLDVAAPWTNTVYAPALTPVSTPIDTYLGRFSPGDLKRTAMETGATPGGSNERFAYGGFNLADQPIRQLYTSGYDATVYALTRNHSAGVSAGKAQFWMRGTSYVHQYSAPVATVAASSITARTQFTVPAAWDYASNVTTYVEFGGIGNMVAGENFDLIGTVYESTVGVTRLNMSVGGRTLDQFLDNDICNPDLWTSFASLVSGEVVLWMSLGTNGCGLGAAEAATFKAKTLTAIAEFRAVYPNGFVLLDTAYLSNIEVGWLPGRRRAYIDIANETVGVLCLDTIGEMGHYEGLLAAALYTAGDSVHFNALGRQHYARAVSDLIARAAA